MDAEPRPGGRPRSVAAQAQRAGAGRLQEVALAVPRCRSSTPCALRRQATTASEKRLFFRPLGSFESTRATLRRRLKTSTQRQAAASPAWPCALCRALTMSS